MTCRSELRDLGICVVSPLFWSTLIIATVRYDSDSRRPPILRDRIQSAGDMETVDEKESSSIEVKVLFFARARDIAGVADMILQVSAGSTAADCLDKVVAKFPSLKEMLECMVVAVNEEYVPGTAVVKHRDELALIPPISGG